MLCGACKTRDVSIGHVKACYSTKYGKPASETGVTVAPKDFIPSVDAKAHKPKSVELPDKGRYAVLDGDVASHFYLVKAKSGKGFVVKTWHASYTHYVGFLFNDHFFRPAKDVINYKGAVAAILASPVQAAILFAQTTGKCSICGRDLKDPKSVGASMGPVCCKKLGLKHGQVAA